MSAELREFLSYLGAFGSGGAIAAACVAYLLKSFLPSYVAEKAKNVATREDIAEITDKIEKVKSEYAVILQELKLHQQLRLAALDRRLAAHQEAFVLWRELLRSVHTADIGKAVLKCQDWWEKNCLYLSETVRESFSDAYSAAQSHHAYVQNRTDAQLAQENWARVIKAGNDIVAAVQLPGLTAAERDEIRQIQEKNTK